MTAYIFLLRLQVLLMVIKDCLGLYTWCGVNNKQTRLSFVLSLRILLLIPSSLLAVLLLPLSWGVVLRSLASKRRLTCGSLLSISCLIDYRRRLLDACNLNWPKEGQFCASWWTQLCEGTVDRGLTGDRGRRSRRGTATHQCAVALRLELIRARIMFCVAMPLQVNFALERLIADATGERLEASVLSHVRDQIWWLTEAFAAYCALVRLFPCNRRANGNIGLDSNRFCHTHTLIRDEHFYACTSRPS